METVAQRDPIIKKAVLKLMELSEDERTRMLLEKREKERMDNSVREKSARIEGEKAKALAIAKNALKMKIPIDDVIKLTGLTRKEIENLQDTNKTS